MSDFDKEAEREKLREKLEKDRQKRQHTQRMSELLLKGATMTNRHCDTCGDPIFRHDGQEFCPTCAAGDGATSDSAAGDDATGDGTAAADRVGSEAHTETRAESERSVDVEPAPDTETAIDGRRASEPATDGRARTEPTPDREREKRAEPSERARGAAPSAAEGASTDSTQPVDSAGTADLSAARESLVRSLTKFSRVAASTDDPRRAKEYLAAAREAAETLDALR